MKLSALIEELTEIKRAGGGDCMVYVSEANNRYGLQVLSSGRVRDYDFGGKKWHGVFLTSRLTSIRSPLWELD